MNNIDVIEELYNVILDRKEKGKENSYTNYLFEKGIDKILKKVGEETTEVIVAAKNTNKDDLIAEICDVIYHMVVLMVEKGVKLEDIKNELNKRRKKVGNKKPERRKIENI